MAYTGSVELISGITPKNNGDFPLVDAKDVRIDDNTRLSDLDFTNNDPNSLLNYFELDSNGYICQINGA